MHRNKKNPKGGTRVMPKISNPQFRETDTGDNVKVMHAIHCSESESLQEIPPTGFLRLPQILKLIPVGASSWWRGVQSGLYPQGVKIGPRTTAWRTEDIIALIKALGNNKEDL